MSKPTTPLPILTQCERCAKVQYKTLEAELALVREWARGRCVTCGLIKDCPKGHFKGVLLWSEAGPCDAWTPAWEVK